MIEKDRTWFNQKYLQHKDTEFNCRGGSLEISVNSNTSDFQSFSTPIFNFSIFNEKIRYNINLKYQDVLDLLNSIGDLMKNIDDIYNNGGSEIKKIYNNKNLRMVFKVSKKIGKKAVLIIISESSTHFGTIAISIDLFLIIVELLKSFKDKYIELPFQLSNRATLSCVLNELKEIKEFNKSLPASIVDLVPQNNHTCSCRSTLDEPVVTTSCKDDDSPPWDEDEDSNKEQHGFDDFITSNIDNIQIPTFDKIQDKPKEEYKSILIENILKNDINNLDSIITSLTTHSNPIEKFRNILSEYMTSTLPSITDDELRSACYYSKRFFLYNIQNYTKNSAKIPSIIPVIKYKPNSFKGENIDMAYDLLTLSLYVRLVKDKLETKISDVSINKSILYMSLRNYTDIFTFSFLDDIDKDIVIACVVNRFQKFSKSGFFKSFAEVLNQYNLQDISEIEIKYFANEIIEKVIGENKTLTIRDLHIKEFDEEKIKLPYCDSLTIEQITNEFVKAEIQMLLDPSNTQVDYSEEVFKILYPTNKSDDSTVVDDEDDWFGNIS